MKILKSFFLVFLSLAFIAVGYYSYSILSFINAISGSASSDSLSNNGDSTYIPPLWEKSERVNILLLGVDPRMLLRPNEKPRSDSIMIVSIDPKTKKAHIFSILRDTYVNIPDHGRERINSAISYGGPGTVMKTVSDFTGLPIQYYIYTDFEGFIALINAVGGIEIDVEKNMYYVDSADDHLYDIDLKKGIQRLDGKKALQYVRFRHDALSDFARTERQRKFLSVVMAELQSTSSIIKLPKILNAIDPYIKTNLDLTTMLRLGSLAFDIKSEGLITAQLPPLHLLKEEVIRGAQVITVKNVSLQQYMKQLLAGEIDTKGNDVVLMSTTSETQ